MPALTLNDPSRTANVSDLLRYPGLGALPAPSFSQGSSAKVESRVRRIAFGDGYEQRSPSGINASVLKLELVYTKQPYRAVEAIAAFLTGRPPFTERTPADYFYLYVPAELYPMGFPEDQLTNGFHPLALKFIYEAFQVTPAEGRLSNLNVSVSQVFDQ